MSRLGIGKNFPVRISLGKDNYEGLIARHGQRVRWRQAVQCPCLQINNRPDLHCSICGGEGWRYRFQSTIDEQISIPMIEDNLAELPEGYETHAIRSITNYAGIECPVSERYGLYVRLSSEYSVKKGERVEAIIGKNLIRALGSTSALYRGDGRFELPDVGNGDIVAVGSLEDAVSGASYPIISFRKDGVLATVSTPPSSGATFTAYSVDILDPPTFVVVGQQHKEADARFLEGIRGDASMSFPQAYQVGEGDIVTLLSAHKVGKCLITRGAAMDVIPEFYIASVESIETEAATYLPGVDFDLWGDNRIRWITGRAKPVLGTAMFIMYQSCPTYRVLKDFPTIRSSEDQELPRRVALQLLGTYSGRKGI